MKQIKTTHLEGHTYYQYLRKLWDPLQIMDFKKLVPCELFWEPIILVTLVHYVTLSSYT